MKNPIDKKYTKLKTLFRLNCITFAGITTLCLATSCKKLVSVDAPTNALVTTSVFSKDGTAITAQLSVYANLPTYLSTNELYTGLSADEFTNYSTAQLNLDFYRNALNAQNDGGFNGQWAGFYNIIYRENAILENVKASTGMSGPVKQLMTGEALFMRALCYFQLVNMFGDVPLVTSTDYSVNSSLPRTPKDQVYGQMVSDLQGAQGLLSATYLDASDNPGQTDRVRPTTWAADGLLARVYLYKGDYANAAKEASLVIANNAMFSLSPLTGANSVFKKNSTEAIWQLMPPTASFATVEGKTFILITQPTNVTISPQLLNAFEIGDARKTNWVGSYTSGGTTWYFPNKYKDGTTATTLNEYSMVLRLAEQYLIRGEAEADLNDLTDAIKDLNVIRARAGLATYAGLTDQASVLTAIAHERQVELFSENDRWFNLKRTNTADAVMTIVTPQKGSAWNSYQQLYPLNVSDLQYDPQLKQNAGY
jgi:hypothetical protein